ncbi:hypothetical protein OHA98_41340 [Streptomyces sp. NBC_00654]|uniref:hypothetical protein n=1 Tax=Streptomyces sp. NBC_00654 TaxID=2975799 RepID=UPI00225AEFB8|nr:hypothetical protein [Streptomyces sp. NBC_00654]MCX4971058.1 hypothetical protein [Streptomyces sp. NBC_00654]
MPSIVQKLSGRRAIGGLRMPVQCSLKTAVVREGPAQSSGAGAAWIAYLCPVHAADLDGWPGVTDHPETGPMSCGTVLDYRSPEEQLQSHADLWLTRLTGVDPAAYDGVWAEVLDQADRVLLTRFEEAGTTGEDSPLQNMLAPMDMARQYAAEGDLGMAATSLGYCETFARNL